MAAFGHRALRVYGAAVEVSGIAYGATRFVDQRSAPLANQLIRACTSIVLNLAEGVAEFAPREKARFYRIARRSAAEASAAFDLLYSFGAIRENASIRGTQRLEAIAGMLTRMIQATGRTEGRVRNHEGLRTRGSVANLDQAATPSVPQKPAPETRPRNVQP